ncbi:hypothetical protein ACFE04_016074 [Oxalis oulophora]
MGEPVPERGSRFIVNVANLLVTAWLGALAVYAFNSKLSLTKDNVDIDEKAEFGIPVAVLPSIISLVGDQIDFNKYQSTFLVLMSTLNKGALDSIFSGKDLYKIVWFIIAILHVMLFFNLEKFRRARDAANIANNAIIIEARDKVIWDEGGGFLAQLN